MKIRVGFGIDVHRLDVGLPLMVGGIQIPSAFGAVGHSDADVLLHAICDALLGAANLRDIGYHFSDKDPQYKDIDSKILLANVVDLLDKKGYRTENMDATVVLEKPKLNPHISEMQSVIAEILKVELDAVSIKATTHEQVDSFGNGLAIKAYATCLILGK
ncbi:MAG: 2-C-methyl-D-erythritol 2,4-cyclodiphosphate synthase [Flavobacteriia bacterium]|nr:2-C-methyl-D-erythritol 2,4-cyclodiphosphate synthase [Flavobacteriia bacterium]NBV91948.1 2-C-methyl-D-erythritol 2,4-cyclodiphosphate synthase [Flavobacteriia bacterium]NBY40017.1 2-C-methyl-D-erythritol 2,4-cyclodiphosphate synthase [Flavobacteriia bacterium]